MLNFITESTKHLKKTLEKNGVNFGDYKISQFADGEYNYRLTKEVRRKPTRIISSILSEPKSIFDLLSVFRILRENHAQNPSLIIPYFGYARQDRVIDKGEAAIGIMVAELIRNINPSKIYILDIHSRKILDALGPQTKEITAIPLIAEKIHSTIDVIVAPDHGAKERAETMSLLLKNHPKTAYIEKIRPKANIAKARKLHGNVHGKRVLIIDDIIDTGGTILEAIRLLKKEGAKEITVAATHGIFSKNCKNKIFKTKVQELIITNSLPQKQQKELIIVDIAKHGVFYT